MRDKENQLEHDLVADKESISKLPLPQPQKTTRLDMEGKCLSMPVGTVQPSKEARGPSPPNQLFSRTWVWSKAEGGHDGMNPPNTESMFCYMYYV